MSLNKFIWTKALTYRATLVALHMALFGTAIALTVNAVNVCVYLAFDYLFFKFFKIRKENKGKVFWFTDYHAVVRRL